MAEKRMEEVVGVMEKNTRTSAELIKKAVDAAQTPAIGESQAKWMEFWTASMTAVESNIEVLMQISTRTVDSWIEFARKNTEATQAQIPKTA